MNPGPLGALLLAVGGLVSIIAAVLIAVRNARAKGRRAALGEADELEVLLAACREDRLVDKDLIYRLRATIAEHGLDP